MGLHLYPDEIQQVIQEARAVLARSADSASVARAMPIRFRVEQMGDQLAMSEQHDPGEQQQYVGQRFGESPVSGHKDSCDVSQLGRNHLKKHDYQSATA